MRKTELISQKGTMASISIFSTKPFVLYIIMHCQKCRLGELANVLDIHASVSNEKNVVMLSKARLLTYVHCITVQETKVGLLC